MVKAEAKKDGSLKDLFDASKIASKYADQIMLAAAEDNYSAFAQAVYKCGNELQHIFAKKQIDTSSLELQIAALENQYKAFLKATNELVEYMLSERKALLGKALEINKQYRSKVRLERLRFAHLIRAIYQNNAYPGSS